MAATPGMINLFNGSVTTPFLPALVPATIGAPGSVWILAGVFKGINWFGIRPGGVLNSGDFYFDVVRGIMLVTDGAGSWYNALSVALPPASVN